MLPLLQGSHNCDETKAKFEPIFQYLSGGEGRLNGMNWLYCGCRKYNDLAHTPKSKKARDEPSESHREDNGEAEEDQSDGEDDEEQEEELEERSPHRNREIIQDSDICPLYKRCNVNMD